jgi:Calcineurin-like phosphoesterase
LTEAPAYVFVLIVPMGLGSGAQVRIDYERGSCREHVCWMEQDAAQQFPAFFYHLGDVVYYDGEHASYYQQFYDTYLHYPAPIFAIPGNHDFDRVAP